MNDLSQYFTPPDIHAIRQARAKGAAIPFVLCAVVAGWLDLLALVALLKGTIGMGIAFLAHALIVAGCAFVARIVHTRGVDCRFLVLLALTVATLGPVGALGSLLSFLLALTFGMYSQSFAVWFRTIFPSLSPRLPEAVYEDIVTGRDEHSRAYTVIPFIDVMDAGSEDQKREALSRIGSHFEPRLAPALLRALADNSNAIRVLAATLIARIENRFLRRSQDIDMLAATYPTDADVLLIAAHHYDDYAFTGILDAVRERQNRDKARGFYEAYLKQQPRDEEALMRLGRLMHRDGRHSEAANILAQCLNEETTPSEVAAGWYMECLYAMGRYDVLRSAAEELLPRLPEHSEVASVVKLWTTHPGAAHV